MNIVGIIPVRMGSTRFPGKPLAKINGISMVEQVYKNSCLSNKLNEVYIATCDEEIKKEVQKFGGNVIMTSNSHKTAIDRTTEAMMKIEVITASVIDIVVMIQGDEPMVQPEMIDSLATELVRNSHIQVVNLIAKIKNEDELFDSNIVKVAINLDNEVLYFSRLNISNFKQTGVIGFNSNLLMTFVGDSKQTPLEMANSIDMFRVIENGGKIKTVIADKEIYSVDTEEDLEKVRKLMKKINEKD